VTKRVVRSALVLAVIGVVVALTITGLATAGPLEQTEQTQPTLGGPTNVGLVLFAAKKVKGKPRNVTITWKTASEPDTLGFNVYREVKGKRTRVNRGLILSRAATIGAVYTQKDVLPKGVRTACYRLQVVSSSGAKVLLPNKPCVKR
jgi:hypothetical protein